VKPITDKNLIKRFSKNGFNEKRNNVRYKPTFEEKVQLEKTKNLEYQKFLENNVLEMAPTSTGPVTYIHQIDRITPKDKSNIMTKQKTKKSQNLTETPKKEPEMEEPNSPQLMVNNQHDSKTFGYALPDNTPYYPWGSTHSSINDLFIVENTQVIPEMSHESFQPPIQPELPEIQSSDIFIREVPITPSNLVLVHLVEVVD